MSFSAQYPPVLTEAGDLTSEVLAKYNQEFQYLYTNLLSALFSATTGHTHTGNGSDGAQLGVGSIADDAITTLKILNEAVTAAKLATDAVTTIKILDGAITTDKFAEDAQCPVAGKVANALTFGADSYDGSAAKTIVLGNLVVVTKGTIANGGTIPLPAGYTQEQCSWIVSPNTYYQYTESDERDLQWTTQICSVDANRVVTALNANVLGGTQSGIANYMIIGVK